MRTHTLPHHSPKNAPHPRSSFPLKERVSERRVSATGMDMHVTVSQHKMKTWGLLLKKIIKNFKRAEH